MSKLENTATLADLFPETDFSHLASREELDGLEEILANRGCPTRPQAELLLAINAESRADSVSPEWQDLFVYLLTRHFLSAGRSDGALDEETARFIIACVVGDRDVNAAECALLVQIVGTAAGTPEFFKRSVLAAVGERVRKAGRVTAGTVDMLAKLVYGTGGYEAGRISREDADFLMEINRLTAGRPNHPSWEKLFTGAVLLHLLHDAKSPGAVVDAEAGWLIEKLREMPERDANIRVLIDTLRAKARVMPDYLVRVLEGIYPSAS